MWQRRSHSSLPFSLTLTYVGLREKAKTIFHNISQEETMGMQPLSLVVILSAVVSLLFHQKAGAQTLAIGELVRERQHVMVIGANPNATLALWEYGMPQFDISAFALQSIKDETWHAIGAGPGMQILRSSRISIATFPALAHTWGANWHDTGVSFLTVGSSVLVEKPILIIGYAGINPAYSFTNRKKTVQALPIGIVAGIWKRISLLFEYDIKTGYVAVGLSFFFNKGIPR